MKKLHFTFLAFIFSAFIFLSCNHYTQQRRSNTDEGSMGGYWNMGVALYSFNHFPLSVALKKADSAGVKFVEGFSFHGLKGEFKDTSMVHLSLYSVAKIKKMLADNNVQMRSMYVSDAKGVKEWNAYFALGKSLGVEYFVCEPRKEDWDILDSLGGVYKIKIAIHEHAKGSSMYWHPDSVLAAIKGHKHIGACADVGHWVRSGLNPVQCLQQLKGHILGVHLKDLDEAGNPRANDVIIGKGVIDFAGIIKELKDQKFKGYAYIECEHSFDDNVADVKESLRYLNNLTTQVQ